MLAPADDRQQYERYKGPFLYQLTAKHLQQLPRPWPEFMYSFTHGSGEMAYNVPAHTRMLWERMEENMVYFLVRCHLLHRSNWHRKRYPVRTQLHFPWWDTAPSVQGNYFTIGAAFGVHLM